MSPIPQYKRKVLDVLHSTPSPVPVRRLLKMLGLAKQTRALRKALRELEQNAMIVRAGRSQDVIWLVHT